MKFALVGWVYLLIGVALAPHGYASEIDDSKPEWGEVPDKFQLTSTEVLRNYEFDVPQNTSLVFKVSTNRETDKRVRIVPSKAVIRKDSGATTYQFYSEVTPFTNFGGSWNELTLVHPPSVDPNRIRFRVDESISVEVLETQTFDQVLVCGVEGLEYPDALNSKIPFFPYRNVIEAVSFGIKTSPDDSSMTTYIKGRRAEDEVTHVRRVDREVVSDIDFSSKEGEGSEGETLLQEATIVLSDNEVDGQTLVLQLQKNPFDARTRGTLEVQRTFEGSANYMLNCFKF